MSSTKIINILKSESFEDTLDIFKETSAQEVIFVLPRKAKAFSKEFHFQTLADLCSQTGKTATFMTSDENVQSWARQYDLSVLASEPRKAAKVNKVVATPVSVQLMDGNENEDAFEMDLDDHIDLIIPTKSTDDDELEDEDYDDEFGPKKKKKAVGDEDDDELEDEPEKEDSLHKDLDDLDVDEDEDDDEEDLDIDEELDKEEEDDFLTGADSVSSGSDVPTATFAMSSSNMRSTRDMGGIIVPRETRPVRVSEIKTKQVPLEVRRETPEEFSDDLNYVWQKSSKSPLWAGIGNREGSQPIINRFKFKIPSLGGKKFFVSLAVLSGIALLAVLFLIEGKATIAITPKDHPLNFSLNASAMDSVSAPDSQFNRIPGQVFKINKDVSGEFSATGEKEVAQKARGTVTVYNNLSTPQTLIATTRFQYTQNGTPSTQIYRSLTSVNIPAKGTAKVEVIADKSGTSYNVAPGKFVIPAFKERNDTARYEGIYAQSTENFSGGISGNSKVVSEKDYNDAKALLTAQLTEEIKKSISDQASGLVIVQSQTPTIGSVNSSAEIDEAAERFSMTISGSAIIIGFREEDMKKLVSDYVSKTNKLDTRTESTNIAYSAVALTSDSRGITFKASVTGTGYEKIPADDIKNNLKGKNQAQIESYLKSLPFIKSAQVTLSPFWIRKVPMDTQKVIIKVI